ncbi:MAG: hypothetical protein DDG60_04490 [Anaerolineae bacterium]|nr:MAG: hypothetical protein DDG60_04490 [Anaerolineae bacterium]
MNKHIISKPTLLLSLLLALMLACGRTASAPTASPPAATAKPTNAPPTPTAVPPTETAIPPTPTPAPTATPPPAGTSPQNPAPFSETVITAGWEIRVVEFVRGEQALVLLKKASPFNRAHRDPAMEYALVKVRVKWTGEGSNRVDGTFFSGMDSALIPYERVKLADAKEPSPSISSFDALTRGQEVEGWVVIQIGKNASGALLVIWPRDNGMRLGEETKRYIALEP